MPYIPSLDMTRPAGSRLDCKHWYVYNQVLVAVFSFVIYKAFKALKLRCVAPVCLPKCTPKIKMRILEGIEPQGNTGSTAIPDYSVKFLDCV